MAINYVTGNLLEAPVEALVNTVNTVGVMGKGIALQFKQAFPHNYEVYRKACQNNELWPGKLLVVPTGSLMNPRMIINFPTKRHWRSPSQLEDIDAGLRALAELIPQLEIDSLALPPLGCGNGGLDWAVVQPRIHAALNGIPDVSILVYEPKGAPEAKEMRVFTKRPKMTPGRAALIGTIERYTIPGYDLSLLEIQKLAYFLQSAGEPLKLDFIKGKYGPYAENLNHVLQRIEGHFIRGYGDRSSINSKISLLSGASEEAENFIQLHPETLERLERVSTLIDGFETPYSMELLSTVHWVAQEENVAAKHDTAKIVASVWAWSDRKRAIFKEAHIKTAFERLQEHRWLN